MGEKTNQLITPAPAVRHRLSFCATRQSFTSRALVQVTMCQSQDDTESSGGRHLWKDPGSSWPGAFPICQEEITSGQGNIAVIEGQMAEAETAEFLRSKHR